MSGSAASDLIGQLLTAKVQAAVAPALAGLGRTFQPEEFASLRSWPELCPTTAGPFEGIGAAVPTWIRWTVIHARDAMIVFADDRLYGVRAYPAGRVPLKDLRTADMVRFTQV